MTYDIRVSVNKYLTQNFKVISKILTLSHYKVSEIKYLYECKALLTNLQTIHKYEYYILKYKC